MGKGGRDWGTEVVEEGESQRQTETEREREMGGGQG